MAGVSADMLQLVGQNIRKRRIELKKSQTDLALDIGSDKAAISRIENGKQAITLDQMAWIAQALHTQAWVLLKPPAEGNTEELIRYVEENADRINACSTKVIAKTKMHMALALDLPE